MLLFILFFDFLTSIIHQLCYQFKTDADKDQPVVHFSTGSVLLRALLYFAGVIRAGWALPKCVCSVCSGLRSQSSSSLSGCSSVCGSRVSVIVLGQLLVFCKSQVPWRTRQLLESQMRFCLLKENIYKGSQIGTWALRGPGTNWLRLWLCDLKGLNKQASACA